MEEREWFADRYEQLMQEEFSREEKASLAKLMLKSEVRIAKFLFHLQAKNFFMCAERAHISLDFFYFFKQMQLF